MKTIAAYDPVEPNAEMQAFGNYIRNCRKAKKLTQQQVADILEITTKSISCMERGINFPSSQNFFRLVKILDMSVDEFLFGCTRYDETVKIPELNDMLVQLEPKDRTTLINLSRMFCELLLRKKDAK